MNSVCLVGVVDGTGMVLVACYIVASELSKTLSNMRCDVLGDGGVD